MNSDEIKAFKRYYTSCWTQAERWEPERWEPWAVYLSEHGPTYVRRALRQLVRDPEFRAFPPGLAALIQAVEEQEVHLIERRQLILRRLARDEAEGDDDSAARGRDALAVIDARLAR